jgi:hypothetical protein
MEEFSGHGVTAFRGLLWEPEDGSNHPLAPSLLIGSPVRCRLLTGATALAPHRRPWRKAPP